MQRKRSNTLRRRYLNLLAGIGLATTAAGSIAGGLFTEMAIYVAHGHKLTIGADILFAGLPSGELACWAATALTIAILAAIAAIAVSFHAEA